MGRFGYVARQTFSLGLWVLTGCESGIVLPSGSVVATTDPAATGTMVSRGSPLITPTVADQILLAGYYEGGTVKGDAALLPGNIASGVSIFGITGNVIASPAVCVSANQSGCVSSASFPSQSTPATPAGVGDVLTGKQFFVGGALTTGTLANNGAPTMTPTTSDQAITAGYYSGGTVKGDSNLVAGKILGGTTLFGVAGTLGFSDFAASSMYRSPATTQMTLLIEESTSTYGAGYREVPIIGSDDDGGNPFVPVLAPASHTGGPCGTSQNTVALRIASCSQSWDGAANGNSGEGLWKLVTRSGVYEVWQDQRTKLLWSDDLTHMGSDANWCQASGNHEAGDSDNICNNTLNQPLIPLSYCVENDKPDGTGTAFHSPVAGEDYVVGTYDSARGGMGRIASGTSPSVRWRLPTIHDFEQAELDGVRFVLPHFGIGGGNATFWSASITSNFRSLAWHFDSYGSVYPDSRGDAIYSVLCVGR